MRRAAASAIIGSTPSSRRVAATSSISRATLAVNHHAADHIIRQLFPLDAGKTFVERLKHALLSAVAAGSQDAFEQDRFESLIDDAAAHLDGDRAADAIRRNHVHPHAIGG